MKLRVRPYQSFTVGFAVSCSFIIAIAAIIYFFRKLPSTVTIGQFLHYASALPILLTALGAFFLALAVVLKRSSERGKVTRREWKGAYNRWELMAKGHEREDAVRAESMRLATKIDTWSTRIESLRNLAAGLELVGAIVLFAAAGLAIALSNGSI